jgi:DNA-binding HxlR family transcriptional regulator
MTGSSQPAIRLHFTTGSLTIAVEAFGDRWSLLVLRDVMFGNRRHFRELLAGSEEKIASNILADRLKRLTDAGLLTRDDARPGQRAAYSLTEAAIQLVPVLTELGAWESGTAPPRPGCGYAPSCWPAVARRCGRSSWTSCARSTSATRPARSLASG